MAVKKGLKNYNKHALKKKWPKSTKNVTLKVKGGSWFDRMEKCDSYNGDWCSHNLCPRSCYDYSQPHPVIDSKEYKGPAESVKLGLFGDSTAVIGRKQGPIQEILKKELMLSIYTIISI